MTVAVNRKAILRLRLEINPDVNTIATDDELARRIGVHPSTMSRVLSGKAKPGEKFIKGVLENLGWDWYQEIFKGTDA